MVVAKVQIPAAALAPIILVVLAWVVYCIWDITHNEVQYLPRWAWILISLASVPLGGIIYLLVGRSTGDRRHQRAA